MLHGHDHAPGGGPWWRTRKVGLAGAAALALLAAYLVGKLEPEIASWAFLVAMLVGLVPIARRAFVAARAGTPFSIEMLMTIAAVGAVIIGASEEAAAVATAGRLAILRWVIRKRSVALSWIGPPCSGRLSPVQIV